MKKTLRVALVMMAVSGFFMVTPLIAFSATLMFQEALQALPQQDRDKITTTMAARHIELMEQQHGLQALTSAESDQLATAMASQEMPLMQELNGGKMSNAGAPNQFMEKIRNQVMGNIVKDIVSHNKDLCKPIIQPYMVQEVSSRIQINTIPMFTPKLIEQVQAHFRGTPKS
ncbi:MAG: hypothetical protein D3923_00155 [Candidatus Electrothrix sp. AR3]|nr:hypothetical protein [Candidatus Electrothrix sp. AR3]